MEEREFELVNIIGANLASSQRDLSRHMDLSLGMTNMLIRRLVTKGYIRIKQLDKKKVQYILTPKGFAEKMQKSVKYTLKTLNSIALMKNRLLVLLKSAYDAGARKFYVLGGSDLAGLIEMTLNENFSHNFQIIRINDMPTDVDGGIVLICRENVTASGLPSARVINVIEELAKDEALLEQGV
ncbi:MAG: winged helix-turn-helix transcriptional regulator [Candidatus Omnitrophica bacterium]|nr:winged helix-turn-helix transcriptional regulator [Candidatus Omnitrophota bacterium]